MQKVGEIRELKRQQNVAMYGATGPILTPTGRQARYVADFTYTDNRLGIFIIEDAKGFRTPEYKLKRAILAAMGITIREV